MHALDNKTDERMATRKQTGSYCVYFTYKMKGTDELIPQIITFGSEDQCKKHIEDYNRQTLPDNRCKLNVGKSSEVNAEIARLKTLYGTVEE